MAERETPEAASRPDAGSPPFRLRVEGDSMSPTVSAGATVQAEPLHGEPAAPGQVVVIGSTNGPPAVHRVIARRRTSSGWLYVTKGDAMHRTDAVVEGRSIVARVTAVEAGGQLTPVPPSRPSVWTALEARGKLLLHGKLGGNHPLRRLARALGRLARREP